MRKRIHVTVAGLFMAAALSVQAQQQTSTQNQAPAQVRSRAEETLEWWNEMLPAAMCTDRSS